MPSPQRLTTLENMLKSTVELNGLLIPVNSIECTLSGYTHPLVVWNHNDTMPCSLMGSCIGIVYRSQYLLLCTRHQLDNVLCGRGYEDVGLLDKDGKDFCSAGGIRCFNAGINDLVLNDLVVFDFTEPCKARPHMRERFFNVLELPPEVAYDQIVAFVVSGYPFNEQSYNLNEDARELGFRRAQAICAAAPDNEQSREDLTTLKLRSHDPIRFKLDGMSGGAAFVIQLVGVKAHAHLAGMTVRGSNDIFHILKIGCILQFIDSWYK